MTRLPRSSGSTFVLRLNQETIHDSVLLLLPPCGPHLIPLATGSLEPSLFVFSITGGLTGNDLSHLFFTCTNTNQAAAILRQESVHTTLSITHHTSKRPSTGSRTTHVLTHLDRRIIRCYYLLQLFSFQSFDATTEWTVGSSDSVNFVWPAA
jgi:hypothetical protein